MSQGIHSLRRLGHGVVLVSVLAIPIIGHPLSAAAQEERSDDERGAVDAATLAELQEQIRELQKQLERIDSAAADEIEALKSRIRELEAQLEEAGVRSGEEADSDTVTDEEIEALRQAALAEVPEESPAEQAAERQRDAMTGYQRRQQDLNPEISFLGDFSYDWSDSEIQDQFVIRAVEIGFQAPLDPYTRFKGFLSAHQEPPELELGPPADEEAHGIEIEIEEAYMDWVALPGNTGVRVGKFRQRFGTLNRWHEHALPSTDQPFALRNLFGAEGLNGIGVGVSWGLPGLWATSHGLAIEITNPDNEVAFAGAEFSDPAYLLRYTGFYDFGADAYLEIGLNGTYGPNDEMSDGKTTIASIDVNYVWEPAARGRYRGFIFRGEYFWSRFEDASMPGAEQTYRSNSWYSYLIWRLTRQWKIGFRYDDAELPSPRSETASGMFAEGLRERAITPFVTFWQSEFVRLRLQYQHAERDFIGPQGPKSDDRVWLQVTWAAGPHKHAAY